MFSKSSGEEISMTHLPSAPDFVPDRYRQDPRIARQLYYMIPQTLWDHVLKEVGESRFSQEDQERETALSEALQQGQRGVGFWDRQLITFPRLMEFHPIPSAEEVQQAEIFPGLTTTQLQRTLQKLSDRTETLTDSVKGYLGWLTTSRLFHDEQDALIERTHEVIIPHGFPHPFPRTSGESLPFQAEPASWGEEWSSFYHRWRLQFLEAPGLPWPIEPQLPRLGPDAHQQEANALNALLPDTIPMGGTGLMAEILEERRQHASDNAHLTEWLEIVSQRNPAKNQIDRYARLFRLQHFWRALHLRYPNELDRNKARMRQAFANWFQVSDDTIKQDLRLIHDRLGAGWDQRPFWPQ